MYVCVFLFQSMGVERQLYAFLYSILCKGFDHPQILVSVGGPGTSPPMHTKGQLKFWESQKLYKDSQQFWRSDVRNRSHWANVTVSAGLCSFWKLQEDARFLVSPSFWKLLPSLTVAPARSSAGLSPACAATCLALTLLPPCSIFRGLLRLFWTHRAR